jgi:hypothetical protein
MSDSHTPDKITIEPTLIVHPDRGYFHLLPPGTPLYKDKNSPNYYVFFYADATQEIERVPQSLKSYKPLALKPLQEQDVKNIIGDIPLSKEDIARIVKTSSLSRQEFEEIINDLSQENQHR